MDRQRREELLKEFRSIQLREGAVRQMETTIRRMKAAAEKDAVLALYRTAPDRIDDRMQQLRGGLSEFEAFGH